MIDSKGSVVVGQQGSLDRLAGAVVVPDRGGQRQDALHDADPHASRGAAAVPFEVELAFERVIDRLDDLPQRFEELRPCSRRLTLTGRAQQVQTGTSQLALKLAAVVVLVRDHDLPHPRGRQLRVGVEDPEQGLALIGLGAGQGEPDRQAMQGAQQVQPRA
jgi:hypothetical protein